MLKYSYRVLCREKQLQEPLNVHDDLFGAQFGFSIDSIHKRNGYFGDFKASTFRSNNDFHLKGVSLALNLRQNFLQYPSFVQSEGPRQVRNARIQQKVCQEIGSLAIVSIDSVSLECQ